MKVSRAALTLLFASTATACTSFQERTSTLDDAGTRGRDAAIPSDAPPPRDARVLHETGPLRDAGSDTLPTRDASVEAARHDSAIEAAVDGGLDAGLDDTGLSALLVLPSADAATCSPVGNITVCSLGNCLIASPGPVGRCQTCSRQGDDCGGHKNSPCATAEDCDLGWACYAGSCTIMCRLDAGSCGYPSTCTNVGNAAEGVCSES